MAKRALLVGSETAGLQGAIGDAERMAEALRWYGFEVDLCVGGNATREGILAGYRRLIERSAPSDAALFYYSGHGGRAVNPDYQPGSALPSHFQCIVPVDLDATTDDDFRGIMAQELSLLLAELTARTQNATVVLDCCHSACMSRDFSARPKALPRPIISGSRAYMKRLAAHGARFDGLHAESNPHAVRLVAAGIDESAFEYTAHSGRHVGVMTESLLLALADARKVVGGEVTWEAIGSRMRERVLSMFPTQRPEVEGPCRRIVFEEREVTRIGALPVVKEQDVVLLRGGRILGIREGDEYAILPWSAASLDRKAMLATAQVVEVRAGDAVLELSPSDAEIPADARAFVLRSAVPRRPVRIEAAAAEREAIVRAIAPEPLLCVEEAQAEGGVRPLATARATGGEIELRDSAGALVVPPAPPSERALEKLASNLRRMAAAQGLRELESRPSEILPDDSIEVEWGCVEDGLAVPLAMSGEVLPVGARVYVKVTNRRPGKRLYVSIYDIGVAHRIALLSTSEPSGVGLDQERPEYVLGRRDGRLKGCELGWSRDLPPLDEEVRPETLIIIVTEQPRDLRALETPGVERMRTADHKGEASPLQQLVSQLQRGGTRDMPGEGAGDESYLVRHIDFLLSPKPAGATVTAAHGEPAFLLDERPPASVMTFSALSTERTGTARGLEIATRPPPRIAVLLTELIVHDTRALFGSADIRIDALSITRLPKNAGAPYRAETRSFSGIRDGERLPLDNVLLYWGDARDFMDLRIWVSRDREEAKTLSEMLDAEINSPALKSAAAALLAVTAAAPHAAALIAATGGAATLGKIAWKLLAQALPKTIGVYQTSLLAVDGFNLGRHPAQGLLRAQGFSLGYEVKAV
ncbi:caspase family protein [Sorangium sp. So ce131]|uniref:caspase family protein n=1 Tax=Sorangium sp. So ce131 TaxID=3133282 RepID=UPI003F637226